MGPRGVSPLNVLGGAVMMVGMVLTTYNVHVLHQMQDQCSGGGGRTTGGSSKTGHARYAVYANHPDSGYLQHVYNVLER